MCGGAAGRLSRHQTWLLSWPPSWILSRIRNQVKTVIILIFLRLKCKITQIITLHHFIHKFTFIAEKKLTKMHFHSKMD